MFFAPAKRTLSSNTLHLIRTVEFKIVYLVPLQSVVYLVSLSPRDRSVQLLDSLWTDEFMIVNLASLQSIIAV